ncbi:MAG: beta strand repeat-containing protein, partial [Acetobacteraceae bacterium]
GVTEDSASALHVTTLTSLGDLTGAVNLAGGGNTIATLGAFSVGAGSLSLTDAGNLLVNGPVSAASISVSGTGGQSVTVGGAMTATGGELSVASGAGGIALGSGAVLSGSPVVLNSGNGTITLSGNAQLGLATETVAMYGAAVSQTGGAVQAASLGGNIAGDAGLSGGNAISALSGFSVGGLLSLNDGSGLSISGPVSLGAASLTAPALTANAALAVNQTLGLNISGSVTEGGSGSVAAAAVSGNVGGNLLLTGGGNQVASLSNIAAGGTLALTDARAVSLSGTIRAPTLVVTATPNQITVENGTQLITGGIARPPGANVSDTYPVPGSGLGGAYFSDFQLIGGMTVSAINGGNSIVRIDAYQGGSINLGIGGTGLVGPTTWLIIDLHGPSTLGSVVGPVTIAALDVIYAQGAAGGFTSLFGTIGGVSGQAAAGIAFIHPAANPRFQVNSCAIGTVNCIVLPILVLPEGNPLSEFSIGALFTGDDSDDLFLPLVSRRDY